MQTKFKPRDQVRDQLTGFEGVIVSRTEFLNGCIRYGVQPIALKDGVPQDTCHFDEEQLDLVTEVVETKRSVRTGGDRPPPQRRPDVER